MLSPEIQGQIQSIANGEPKIENNMWISFSNERLLGEAFLNESGRLDHNVFCMDFL